MRRITLMLSTLLIVAGYLVGPVAGQDPSVFRYASDPFAEDAVEAAEAPTEDATSEGDADSAGKETSYDSYSSWPSGAKNLVQRKAIYRAQQRALRIAARQWYGYSASRPPVHGNPYYMDVYAPSLWSNAGYTQQSLYGPFGWYFPRRSISAYRWSPYNTYAASIVR